MGLQLAGESVLLEPLTKSAFRHPRSMERVPRKEDG